MTMETLTNPCANCANCIVCNCQCKLFGYALSKCDRYMEYTIQQDALVDWESEMNPEPPEEDDCFEKNMSDIVESEICNDMDDDTYWDDMESIYDDPEDYDTDWIYEDQKAFEDAWNAQLPDPYID